MSELNNKKIILAVCGGVAAYKSAELLRLLIKQNAQVQVVMTQAAQEFISPLSLQALSGQLVRCDMFDQAAEAGMGHIELARWADLIIIAPTTANTLAKIANGVADNLLTTLCLASKAPLLLAPAMNQQMWLNEMTQKNLAKLKLRQNIHICGPAIGEQACGDNGPGRMLEPELIINCMTKLVESLKQLDVTGLLQNKHIMITAGPTVEDIDPVRYITNRSSGKMGYAIAQAASEAGAEVSLVSGPVSLMAPEKVQVYPVRSAVQMQEAVMQHIQDIDIFIATAAVADYRPMAIEQQKIKKHSDNLTLTLIKNPDILSTVSALENKPFTIGFAAETTNIKQYAIEKLKKKNLDMIAANLVGDSQGFEVDENELLLFWHQVDDLTAVASKKLPKANKMQLARQLISVIAERLESERV